MLADLSSKEPEPSGAQPGQPGLGGAELAAWQGMLAAHATLIRELDRRLRAAHGLGVSEFDVLITLFNGAERGVRMTDLAKAIMLSPAGLTHMVTRLERDRLVERAVDPADRRSFLVRLTPDGRARLDAARGTHDAVIRDRFTAKLSRARLQQLAGIWEAILR
jgi:DNA-binding MarR family transcriptional regulator